MRSNKTYTMTVSAVLIAVGLVLPFVTGQIPAIAKIISPMHIPVYICGLTCGAVPALIVGFILPLLRSLLFGMPRLMPSAVAMAFELAAYGAVSGLLYSRCRRAGGRNFMQIIASMAAAMVIGRIVGGSVMAAIMGFTGAEYSMKMFVAAYFVNSAPGALIHIILVPAVVAALEKASLSPLAKNCKTQEAGKAE